jgi:hypothetical protein
MYVSGTYKTTEGRRRPEHQRRLLAHGNRVSCVTDSSADSPVLSAAETRAAESILAAYGADPSAGILIMEDLGPGSSLADSLLARDRGHAEADLVSYARAMATMHAWSVRRSREYAEIRARNTPAGDSRWVRIG